MRMMMLGPCVFMAILHAANSTGWMWPGYIHSALIPASTLKPGKRYVYRYGSDVSGKSRTLPHTAWYPSRRLSV